jgi:glycine betaine/proline transport system permease protein
MAVALAPSPSVISTSARRYAVAIILMVGIVLLGRLTGGKAKFADVPTWLDAHVKPRTDIIYKWVVLNNQKHWIFTRFFDPITGVLRGINTAVLWLLKSLRWPGLMALTAVIGARTGGRKAALVGVSSLAMCGVLGFWDETVVSLALMVVAVSVSLLIGVPLGVWAGLNDRVNRRLRSVLDTAQVMPAYVYLLPIVGLFGIKDTGAVIAAVIFAVAPAVRLTSLGLRGVPVVANEVGASYGCTRRQLLTKVQLPMARRAILLGLNQVIMMAFAILVIAALIGAGGLGQAVLAGLQKTDVGRAFVPGLVIVFAAVALDRITTGQRRTAKAGSFLSKVNDWLPDRRAQVGAAVLGIVLVAIVAKLVGANSFPEALQVNITKPINSMVTWTNGHVRKGLPVIGGTTRLNEVLVTDVLTPLRDAFQYLAWWLAVLLVGLIGWLSGGRRLGLLCGACMVGIAALRTWDLAMDTLSQVLVAVVISIVLAVPIGILAGRSDRFERAIRPLLDAAQVMPSFVYLVPVVFLFEVGRVPGVIASVIYALPPGIRLTSLGLREVSASVREAAVSFGATPRQELLKVQLPLALRSIMLGINQTILMVLSMVVVAGLIGAGALGLETLYGLTKKEIGRGLAGGVSIVLLAIVLDRLTQAWGSRTAGQSQASS